MTLLLGDMRLVLAAMEPKSVHQCSTSPPFYSKRKYSGEQTAIWGGETGCQHDWGQHLVHKSKRYDFGTSTLSGSNADQMGEMTWQTESAFCARCGAWRGALGHEPTPDLFTAHLIECFRAVRRVLRDDGCLAVEIGDSYAGSNAGSNDYRPEGASLSKSDAKYQGQKPGNIRGIPVQTRIGIPERFALAMAADGWRWRDSLIWRHTSAMPESVHGWAWTRCRVKTKAGNTSVPQQTREAGQSSWTVYSGQGTQREALHNSQYADCPGCPKCEPNGGLVLRRGQWRATVAHSYVYVFSKTAAYYGDGEAVKVAAKPETWGLNADGGYNGHALSDYAAGGAQDPSAVKARIAANTDRNGSNLRSVLDIGPEPFSLELCAACRHVYKAKHYARLPKRDGKRVCSCGATEWVSHYATFPTKLPELFIRAFTSEVGCCPTCGAPHARVIEHKNMEIDRSDWAERSGDRRGSSGTMVEPPTTKTIGWLPTCRCNPDVAAPAVVLDPFCGTGSTLVAAQRNGRGYIGVDCSEDYLALAAARLAETPVALR